MSNVINGSKQSMKHCRGSNIFFSKGTSHTRHHQDRTSRKIEILVYYFIKICSEGLSGDSENDNLCY